MLQIGITGGIGSGKTVVCKIFEVLGYPVFYADKEAQRVMKDDAQLVENIKSTFGEASYLDSGEVNRKFLADVVFHDQIKLAMLNQLVHPATIKAYENWVKEQKTLLVFKEAALLFESGSYKLSDMNVLVTAPLDLRIKRVMKRDNVSKDAVISRVNKQMEDFEKEKLADFVVVNNDQIALIPQVLKLHRYFIDMRPKG
ncbi:dephospho-CoA kinase [Olivibacter sp. SDN3]|uniref:dephospho-CoA kinase n=1 Tax=Olivibacter sp. SDN3 TaxID=2764720 RepID=UPI00165193C0|nr:dephospho-CoA kinase [Olivibacter sp. SDN3]QNL49520.1 dephospho-CoA kinase [Olivibacter sp. SDN3]